METSHRFLDDKIPVETSMESGGRRKRSVKIKTRVWEQREKSFEIEGQSSRGTKLEGQTRGSGELGSSRGTRNKGKK